MKKSLILCVICISIFGFGQNINLIKKQVEIINKTKNLVVKKITNDYFTDVKHEVTDNGQEIEAHYNKNELKKMVHSVGLSSSEFTTQFYYDKKKLIFVLRKKYQTMDENGNFINPKLVSESILF